MRLILILLALTLCGAPAFAQAPIAEAEGQPLPDALNQLLAAAHASSEDDFEDAVRLITLTEDPAAVASAAARIDAMSGARARALLGLPDGGPLAGLAEDGALASASEDTGLAEPAEPVAPGFLARAAAPLAASRALVSGDSDVWEGRAELGLRFDSGNSDRQDYKIALAVERALAVWGFEAALGYAYSEVDGAVGRDEFDAQARLEREAGERWTLFLHGEYEQDALSGFDYTAFLAAGAGYRVYDRPELAWVLRAAPGARLIQDAAGSTTTDPALELSSDFEWQVSEPVRFTSDTSALVSDNSRAEQVFKLETALGALWSLSLGYQYTYEFEPEPGFENGESRTDITIVRLF
ncbi:MAG: DUF481 domain-containing protein [Oceanicaulis sp.]